MYRVQSTISDILNYKVSIHCCIPSLRDGLALCIVRVKHSLKKKKHESISSWALSKMILFLWFHKLQQPMIKYSLTQRTLCLDFPSIRSWIVSSDIFQVWDSRLQNFWLKGHPKNRCWVVSRGVVWHSTHDLSSSCIFFLVSGSLELSLSCSSLQKKNLCLSWTQDFHIQANGLGACSHGVRCA